ncbi:hypothetical protein DSM104443_01221 [Usitatibacter rugosus]|uniref:DUF4331 domain-containing protein n=1 Tax=Usitatibacter rugosus TaxID=2732067 RepID=A0A6M4GX50_9PROT|nr:DUF4331 family protein [Usitatibacter rugosus]QJR10167.1 hypothetical protein DSM104443_01221 [Usitatibacter rugosus]
MSASSRTTLSRAFASAIALAASAAVMSADHAESPGTDADPAADLADVFIFTSPQSGAKTVAAITFGGRAAPRSRIDGSFYCDPNVLYTLHIDREAPNGTFDNVPDVEIRARLGTNGKGECGLQLENVPGAGGTFSGPTEEVFTSPTGMRAFAGLRNDPFFFDGEGYAALVASFAAPGQNGDVVGAFRLVGNQPRRDSFANRNVSAIVFEMPNVDLAPPSGNFRPRVRVWATTARLVS